MRGKGGRPGEDVHGSGEGLVYASLDFTFRYVARRENDRKAVVHCTVLCTISRTALGRAVCVPLNIVNRSCINTRSRRN